MKIRIDIFNKISNFFQKNRSNSQIWKILFLCAIIGVIAGLGAILFHNLLELSKYFFFDFIIGYHPKGPGGETPVFPELHTNLKRWLFLIIPAIGAGLGGILVYLLAPEAEGHGTDAAIEAYHHKEGSVRGIVPIVKMIASALTIGSGGSAGREGPIAQIGSGFGSLLGKWLKLDGSERRILMIAGMAGGIGAIFHAPIAGALFASEVLYRNIDFEYEAIIPASISSIIAYSLFTSVYGWDPLFNPPDFVFTNPLQLIPYLVLALFLALGATIYIRTFYGIHDLFKKLPLPKYLKPAIGGLLTGIIGFFLPEALGTGYGTIQDALFGNTGIILLVLIVFAKIATTSFTVGSGGSGGIFGPAIVIGGAIGGVVGITFQQYFPIFQINSGSFVLVGMAGFFAAAANTPISTIVMVSELTGNYHLLVPSLWVCIIAFILARKNTLYIKQISSRFDAPIHRRNMIKAILKHSEINKVFDLKKVKEEITVTPSIHIKELFHLSNNTSQSIFPVLYKEHLIGIVLSRDLRYILTEKKIDSLGLIVEDIMHPPIFVDIKNTLDTAVNKINEYDLDAIPIVNKTKYLKLLSFNKITKIYDSLLESNLKVKNQ